jgi:hypothetical protein
MPQRTRTVHDRQLTNQRGHILVIDWVVLGIDSLVERSAYRCPQVSRIFVTHIEGSFLPRSTQQFGDISLTEGLFVDQVEGAVISHAALPLFAR